MSPKIDPVALQESVFFLLEPILYIQRFIFSKSTNLHLISIYSIGIIFKMRKSVQQLCLNPSIYGSFFTKQLHNFFKLRVVHPVLQEYSLYLLSVMHNSLLQSKNYAINTYMFRPHGVIFRLIKYVSYKVRL